MRKAGVERRAHPRVPTNIEVQGSVGPDGVVARMVADNLSLAGLCCTSSTRFPEMTRLAVRLMLPSGNGKREAECVDLEAVVVRSVDAPAAASGEPRFELGLFFTRVEDADRERLAAFIRSGEAKRATQTLH